ncbi:metalloregulator ArsR/SmtB family transcription factor [bacterium]|nr:metalloregulator ArsR/SmtB family transcription factor [bacterium]MBU1072794.1 metalloregulator ArsR/SmtB family transcription factor [bacterium]MBU1676759.1 metalloregulator ArsR/SmtB family transcription factor [bacterium]
MSSRQPCCSDLQKWLEPDTFKVLGDPSRTALLLLLADSPGPRTVTALAAGLPIDISVVSRHLRILRDVGVVHAIKRGKEVHYHLDCGDLARRLRHLADALDACRPSCALKPEEST